MAYTGCLSGAAAAEERSSKDKNFGSSTSSKHIISFGLSTTFHQYLVRIIGLFQGRVIDNPEQATLETGFATGGEVEHEVYISLHLLIWLIVQFNGSTVKC